MTLDDVSLEYDGRRVLEGVSSEITAGGITAFIGASGAGKTTLVDLITGLCVPQRGAVAIDGVPPPELDLRRQREMIGYVSQETLLLNDSVRRNVTPGDPSLGDAGVAGRIYRIENQTARRASASEPAATSAEAVA